MYNFNTLLSLCKIVLVEKIKSFYALRMLDILFIFVSNSSASYVVFQVNKKFAIRFAVEDLCELVLQMFLQTQWSW